MNCGQHLEKQVRTLSGVALSHIYHKTGESLCWTCSHLQEILTSVWVRGGTREQCAGGRGPFMFLCQCYMYSGLFAISTSRKPYTDKQKGVWCSCTLWDVVNTPTRVLWILQAVTCSTSWAQTGFVIGNWQSKKSRSAELDISFIRSSLMYSSSGRCPEMPMLIRWPELKLNVNESPELEATHSHPQLVTWRRLVMCPSHRIPPAQHTL